MSEQLDQAVDLVETACAEKSTNDDNYVFQAYDLTKVYSRKKVVNNINMSIRKGEIYGFIGKNGAGKTTTIKMISGLTSPTKGYVELFGSKNLCKGRKKIGTIIESPALYPYMTARQNLETQRILRGVEDKSVVDELLGIVGLQNVGKKKAKNFSLGMKQRLAIALALVGNPEFLLLDEPINGLDPSGIKEVRELILKLNREAGITVLISSHFLGELYKMATSYGVICDGELVAQFSAEELHQRVKSCVRLVVDDPESAIEVINAKFGETEINVKDNTLLVYGLDDRIIELNSALEESDVKVKSFVKDDGDYENYFIDLMNGGQK